MGEERVDERVIRHVIRQEFKEGLDLEIKFELSDDELDLVKKCAESQGVSMDILIREAILNIIEDDINKREAMLIRSREQLEKDKVHGSLRILDI